jgi:hypothetical protein
MKKTKILIAAVATIVSQFLTVNSGNAQSSNTFPAFVSALAISTSTNGNFTYRPFGNWDLIRHCAAEQGLTNLMGLRVVYDLNADAIEVVSGTNKTVVCTPLTFSTDVKLSDTNNTSQRLAWVSWEGSSSPNGTLADREHRQYGTSNQLTGFSLIGQLQFAVPASGTNAAVIYRGSVVAASDFFTAFCFGEGDSR